MPAAQGGEGCEIFMTKRHVYAIERKHDVVEVWASRTGNCCQAVRVHWRIAGSDDGGGTAVEGLHYKKSSGELFFPAGSTVCAHPACVPLIDSEFWEPVREFAVVLDKVVLGEDHAHIGKLSCTVVTIVDADL
eukprot:1397287-Rhodomonas_salina.1